MKFNLQETKYIRQCMLKQDWWQAKKIIEKIDEANKKQIKEKKCNHSFKVYTGETYKCCFCGKLPSDGGYKTWRMVDN